MNHCELPAMSVSAFAIQPPVQDSAVATLRRPPSRCRPTRAARRARSRSEFGIGFELKLYFLDILMDAQREQYFAKARAQKPREPYHFGRHGDQRTHPRGIAPFASCGC